MDAEEVAARLERNGILAYVSSTNSHLFGRIQSGALKVSLWIVLDHQYDDAADYLQNENHEITTALTPDEIEELRSKTKDASTVFFNRVLVVAGILLLIFGAALWYFLRNYLGDI